jgi:hypothetical protein
VVAGGGRAVEVEPERLAGWLRRFGERHGGVAATLLDPHHVWVGAEDGEQASIDVPYGPLEGVRAQEHEGLAVEPLLAHVLRPRHIGLMLVRLGGHSIGIAHDGRILASTTDSRLVHGRNKAGGWSQQRFARRREGQARQALHAAAQDAARLLLPHADQLDAVVLGGDRQALEVLRADSRLARLFAMAQPRVLDVPEPRSAVLAAAARRSRCVEVVVTQP